MATIKLDIDLEEFDVEDLVHFLKYHKQYKVIKPATIIDSAKLNHFLEVYKTYSLEAIQHILPIK